jgi:beta-N-acetylhexosaminidase
MHISGRIFLIGFKGKRVTSHLREMIGEWGVAGVVLSARNIEDRAQLSSLCAELRDLRARVSRDPLIIAIHHEGGFVHRLGACATRFPSPMAVAATGNVENARAVGECMGRELLSLGINMNIAPVLDVNTNRENPIIGVRSFGDDPERVGAFGAAMVDGMQRVGLASVVKHFPGMGFAEQDSHMEQPVIAKSVEELERQELVPFRRVIAAGVYGVMVGHMRYPSISPRPASLSRRIVNDLLRIKLGFGGPVLTDDLETYAMTNRRTVGKVTVKAYEAGASLIVVGHSRMEQVEAMQDLGIALKEQRIGRGEAHKQLRLLYEFIGKLPVRRRAGGSVDTGEGETLARRIAEEAVTLVSDENSVIPLRIEGRKKLLLIYPDVGPLNTVEDDSGQLEDLVNIVRARHLQTEAVRFDIVHSRAIFKGIKRAIRDAEVVVMATCDAHRYGEQEDLLQEVAESGKPAIFIALRDPYDVELFPPNSARIATYGTDSHTVAALGELLWGEITPRGTLPISLKEELRVPFA